ncbi:Ribosome biogenesis protein nsa1 (NOP7-associated protein 1) [Coemansia sp. RSA 1813]|nr:Ribosome biogenesis protein nsa1 (NOP7-associated protein 1) [Coemansia sp. RSA 1646]KAJ1765492.1 Ribosome biogenesis protein nsa1 (NOP7-associated protein 1) [Coemansia sp. RSA 1843]KAJ2087842.1 Ribosome biogenesis protein nsa1 (NOP7-associated protein 1) [Coemansia sp. RSA 986]KAJ2212734.1 Ribosome biogenesis protein nsa1 (NOP7-associated protein 1) [Coemansia sp. RSA 487]KAJ2567473.1 Ribosome biogenesis protein nsa1 (NOP7-associated protein 1) [Coemansia sp. RSA 1813]
MRFYTADEVGLVKGVDIDAKVPFLEAQAAAAKKLRLEAKSKAAKEITGKASATVAADQETEDSTILAGVEIWAHSGIVSRDKSIQQMTTATTTEGETFVVGRKNGAIEAITKTEGRPIYEYVDPQFTSTASIKHNGRLITERSFVGIGATDEYFISCTNLGEVRYQQFNGNQDPILMKLPVDACRMRTHGKDRNVFAVGGREQELSIWDINTMTTGNSAIATYTKPTNAPLFKSKNVAHDNLGLRVPVWITDMQFLSDDTTNPHVAVSTGHKQIRIYDAKVGSQPVHDWNTVSKHPIYHILASHVKPELFFADNVGNLQQLDLRMGRVVGGYKGIAGAVRSIALSEDGAMVAEAGLDRFVRVYETDGMRRLLHRAYVKQRVTHVHWDWSVKDLTHDEIEQQEVDELWDNMDTFHNKASSKSEKKKKRTATAGVKRKTAASS